MKDVVPPTQPNKGTSVILCSTPHPRIAMGVESLMQIPHRQKHQYVQDVISSDAVVVIILPEFSWNKVLFRF